MFDFQLQQIDASNGTGRVKVFVDNQLLFTSPSGNIPFTTAVVTVPCGDHTISLALEVDQGNNGWRVCFDNVHADCDISTPVNPSTWGLIKSIFEE